MLCFKNLTVFCFLFVQPYNKQKTENSKVFELPFFSEKILLYNIYIYIIYNNIILEKTYPFKNQTVFCFLFVSFVNKTVFPDSVDSLPEKVDLVRNQLTFHILLLTLY